VKQEPELHEEAADHVRTTMIYTHALNHGGRDGRNPMDAA
jgi:hypothetical protein